MHFEKMQFMTRRVNSCANGAIHGAKREFMCEAPIAIHGAQREFMRVAQIAVHGAKREFMYETPLCEKTCRILKVFSEMRKNS